MKNIPSERVFKEFPHLKSETAIKLYLYLCAVGEEGKPTRINLHDFIDMSGCGIDAVYRAIHKLIDMGYLEKRGNEFTFFITAK